ncbi:UDP-2,3-diacylglucosamine diphosphatase [Thiomicrospira microaerophila]|uniref:UDP-2,3-diacylglucosamine diphosphatase n=1 Tax=Thiomicrospira microaerophila TaxID=406020 RepID=UPI0005C98A51|nr:UDP-2,3-diacylglucosamine diphosphatase [Thiomicrospira microaerophila]
MPQQALCYILADVHLQPDPQHPVNQLFHQFLTRLAPQADEIYILGDLFESWVGDDIELSRYQTEINLLKQVSDQGTHLHIAYGNRDFLMRGLFERATGADVIRQDIIIETIQGTPFLLLHGDTLCTDDVSYQKMRRWLHKPWIQWLFLHLPQKTRLKIADSMRKNSGQATASKSQQAMDVNLQTVKTILAEHKFIEHMIHGHTHRPHRHATHLKSGDKTRWVVGDWHPQSAKFIQIKNGQPEFIQYSG